MHEATGRFESEHGQKYLTQLCKHFAHKIEVTYSDRHGECLFPFGKAVMDADDQGLTVHLTVQDGEQLARAKSVIEDHLARFAFREADKTMTWNA
ncbi:MAG: 2,4-dihydroxyhept-2-ene-1,7-dioic acid aldolase [Kaistia sp. SCN 65-12]|nr:MAG: 2,4-dihydroxyhept-2-ene-1,7-dioic acid aldolase [Kaistia sp. SCN 65-12]